MARIAGSGTDTPAGQPPADDGMGDFTVESASSPDAFEEQPADTTAGADDAAGDDADDQGDADDATTQDSDSAEGEDATEQADGTVETSAGADSKTREAAQRTAKGKETPKGKESLTQRVSQLRREVDKLTFTKHRTVKETATLDARKRELEGVVAALEAKAGGKPTEKPATGTTAAVDAGPRPKHPKYADFATDEDYEAAVGKYEESLGTWLESREKAIEERVLGTVDGRFKDTSERAEMVRAVQTVQATVEKFAADKTDWDERRESLKDLESPWRNPDVHGEDATPFLTDVARTLTTQGHVEGAELLYWLGDPAQTDRAHRVAALYPSKALRDAIVNVPPPSVIQLFDYFATDAGTKEFDRIKRMHPDAQKVAVGALLASRTAPVTSGSGARRHSITRATPTARPRSADAGARPDAESRRDDPHKPKSSFDDWMAEEDKQDAAKKKAALGIAV